VQEWLEFYEIEPWGAWRDNFHAAMVACLIANAHRDPKKKAFGMSEFFYLDAQTSAEKKDEALLAFLEGLVKDD